MVSVWRCRHRGKTSPNHGAPNTTKTLRKITLKLLSFCTLESLVHRRKVPFFPSVGETVSTASTSQPVTLRYSVPAHPSNTVSNTEKSGTTSRTRTTPSTSIAKVDWSTPDWSKSIQPSASASKSFSTVRPSTSALGAGASFLSRLACLGKANPTQDH